MASVEREPITGSGAEPPAGSRDRAPGQRIREQSPPEAESFLRIRHPKEGANRWFDCHECHLESFLVWNTTEDSFIIGSACGKSGGGLRSLKALEFENWGDSSLAALEKFTPMV